jgi:hypothetical protein
MLKTDKYHYQFKTFLKIADSLQKKMESLVDQNIPGESHEKFLLYISYDIERCAKQPIPGTPHCYWDIPEYTNGTTRHAKCLFLLPWHSVGDACHPYLIQDTSEVEKRYLQNKGYDREKILLSEFFGEDLIEVVWSFDYDKPRKEGNYYYSIDKFWFGIKKDNVLILKSKSIKELIKADLTM